MPMNFNLFNNLVKEIPTNLRRFIARKLKRFHAIPRAHKVIEKTVTDKGERAPLPTRIQEQIDEVLKNKPDLLKAVSSDHNESLLERLKKVFVSSIGENKDMFDKTRLTPIEYNLFKPDVIEEYKENIPEGKFSLQQAVFFLQEFKRKPDMRTVESLSEKLKIEPQNIMCMLTHTKIFRTAAPINVKSERKSVLQRATESMLPSIMETEPDEDKMYRILDTRGTKFQQYYDEKLGMKNHDFHGTVKNPALRRVLINMNILKDKQENTDSTKLMESVPTPDKRTDVNVVTSDGKTESILVNDLKLGEDPNEFEGIPEFPRSQQMIGAKSTIPGPANREDGEKIFYPYQDTFDVFKVMEEQDREARKEARRLKRLKKKEEEQGSEREPEDEQQKVAIPEKISSERT